MTNFGTLLSYEQPTKYIVNDTNYKPTYKTPVLTAGKSFILGYTNETENIFDDLPVIIFDDFTTESKFVDFPFKVKSSAMKILHINQDLVLPKYAFYLMQATEIDHENHQRYWISTYSQEIISLPPLSEQIKIIEAVENLFDLTHSVETNSKNLKNSIKSTKSKILDLAIRGKLVPQDPNDEPASVLLDRIREEKEELIKQGKIKRDKKESVIFKGDDNSYYQDLPQNWQVSTLREVTTPLTLNDGDWILSENMTDNGEVKLLQLGSIGNMSYIDKGFKYLTKDTFDKLSCTEIFTGYLIINRIISDKMCCCIVPDIDGTIITTVDTCWIAPSETSYNIKFLMYQLASPSFQSAVLLKATGTTRKRISKNNLIDLHLLLPPLAEQRRIVNAIEALFAQIDKISEQIS